MFSVTEALSLNTAEVTTSEFSPAAAIVRLGGAGVNGALDLGLDEKFRLGRLGT